MTDGGDRSPGPGPLADRRAWLFPAGRGTWQGIDLDALDPSVPEDRSVLVRAEHPEMAGGEDPAADLGGSDDEDARAGVLHLSLHEIVASQLWAGDPPETGEAADRLRRLGYERHQVLHMLGAVVAEEIVGVAGGAPPFGTAERRRRLGELPGSWFRGFEDGGDDPGTGDGAGDDDELEARCTEAHRLLGERGPLTPEELAEALGVDEDDVEAVAEELSLLLLSEGRLASAAHVLHGATITHRLSASEAAAGLVELGTNLAPLYALVCDDGHLHLPATAVAVPGEAASGEPALSLHDLGLPALGEGALVGFTVVDPDDVPTVEAGVVEAAGATTTTTTTTTTTARLRGSFERLNEGDGMPVPPTELVCQLLLDAPDRTGEPLPPLEEILDAGGFEVRHGHVAPLGTDWERFGRLRSVARLASRRGLGTDGAHLLIGLVEAARLSAEVGGRDGRPGREAAGALARLLANEEMAEAFAEAVQEDEGAARSFVQQLRQGTGRRHEAALWWCESLLAGRAGHVDAAQACLRSAIAADPEHDQALADAAWYASDRGDAAEAARLFRRAADGDHDRAALLRHLADQVGPPATVGRNDPCPCGSGRKYKQCCLARPTGATSLPLEHRVRWLWEKLRWWLERFGPMDQALIAAFVLQGTGAPAASIELAIDLDVAASLVLFADGAVTDFLHRRGALLPVDEANLVAQWSLCGPSVHEVVRVREGEGMDLRDLRSGDVVAVRERSASRTLQDGDLVLAHPVFDGAGYQFVGGVVPVTMRQRGPLMALLDEERGALAIADELASVRRRPALMNTEGEPTVLCQGSYRLADPEGAAGRLDAVLARQEQGLWAEMLERDGREVVRANASIEGETLLLWANSEARFGRVKELVAGALGPLDVVEETCETVEEAARRRREADGADAGPAARPAPFEPSPEVAEAMARFVREREVAWLDEPVPALGGLTPRQAADDPTRREDLLALLHEYERTPVPEGAVTYDVSRLRDLLGVRGT